MLLDGVDDELVEVGKMLHWRVPTPCASLWGVRAWFAITVDTNTGSPTKTSSFSVGFLNKYCLNLEIRVATNVAKDLLSVSASGSGRLIGLILGGKRLGISILRCPLIFDLNPPFSLY